MSMFQQLDDLLRGRASNPEKLKEGTGHLHAGLLLIASLLLGATYGVFMGLFSVLNHEPRLYQQLLSSAIKVPALFMLTLFVTFPSLYVFSALLGARLSLLSTLRIFVAGISITIIVLASLGPVMGFFVITSSNYDFIKLLNVAIFGVSAIIGLKFLTGLLQKLEQVELARFTAQNTPAEEPQTPLPPTVPSALPMARLVEMRLYSRGILRIWIILYIVVGCQMAWILRPFIGTPGRGFEIFRERHANFFVDLVNTLKALLS